MASTVWIKVVSMRPERDWTKVPLSEVEDIDDLKRVIKEQLAPALDGYSI